MAAVEEESSTMPNFVASLKEALNGSGSAARPSPPRSISSPSGTRSPRLLLSNDDGIGAPGLGALARALVRGGRCNVNVCAPDSNKSGAGHGITAHGLLEVGSVEIAGAAAAYEVSGTPVDCVSLSLSGALFPWSKPDLIISGINKGSNCGLHIIYSGTVAAAREACILGVPALSISYDWVRGKSQEEDLDLAAAAVLPLIYAALQDIESGKFPTGCFFNIDIPTDVKNNKGFKVTRQGSSILTSQWRAVSTQRRIANYMRGRGEPGMGVQLAQIGLAASAAGAARKANFPSKTVEVETVAGPENGTQQQSSQKQLFQLEVSDREFGETDPELDRGALDAGYITITPLGLTTHLDSDTVQSARKWVCSAVEVTGLAAL